MIEKTDFIAHLDLADKTLSFPAGKMTFYDECYADFQIQQVGKGWRCQIMLHAKELLVVDNFRLVFNYGFRSSDHIFCNGYQSWSESKEHQFGQSIPRIRWGMQKRLTYFGDDHIAQVQRNTNTLHSWTYSYIKREKQPLFFIGSANETTGFTLIHFHENTNEVSIEKECKGLHLKHSFPILDVWIGEGEEQDCFTQWFDLQQIKPPNVRPATGWTSWYYHYTNISEDIILKNLNTFKQKAVEIDFFQIDDGWQKAVGDWLIIRNTFPNGMGQLAQQIHESGYAAGLWLAPFICVKQSLIFQQKKHWLLKNDKGEPISLGYIPHWKSEFYVLDFYEKGVQDYLVQVFHQVLHQWQFDLVKLDFLYAACILPPPNKTRGQMMHDAMQFLRDRCGDKMILGCGVPLGAAFGKVDYCRIGTDVHLQWENKWLRFFHHRERVSTIASLRNTLYRWQLNGRVFYNDPDVFILRDEMQKLTPNQQYTLLIINALLGGLLFTSDDLDNYSEEQWSEYLSIFKWKNSEIQKVETVVKDIFQIEFLHEEQRYVAHCNLTGERFRMKNNLSLDPYESIILNYY